jgi:phage terminase small subunit
VTPLATKHGKIPVPPPHLEAPELALWRALVATYAFDEPASLELLMVACEARGRARRCRERIRADGGEVVEDRWKQLQRHPLLSAESHAQASFLSAMRQLRLDIAGEEDR